ncbi:MAG: glutaminase, partial [Microbacteriaceae bacterium]|nr:glutaminase [Microbacteriaceae bacterium]
RLDARGNSIRGLVMLESLSREYGLHLFSHENSLRRGPIRP